MYKLPRGSSWRWRDVERRITGKKEGFGFVGLKLRTVLLVSKLFCMHAKRWLLTPQQGHGSTILGTVGWLQIRSLDRRRVGMDGDMILK